MENVTANELKLFIGAVTLLSVVLNIGGTWAVSKWRLAAHDKKFAEYDSLLFNRGNGLIHDVAKQGEEIKVIKATCAERYPGRAHAS